MVNSVKLIHFWNGIRKRVFIAGDISISGPVDAVDDVLARIDVPWFADTGNRDPRRDPRDA